MWRGDILLSCAVIEALEFRFKIFVDDFGLPSICDSTIQGIQAKDGLSGNSEMIC